MAELTDLRTYRVSGMTCSSCARTVQGALEKNRDVVRAFVDHATGRAELELRMPVPFPVLQRLLSGTNYDLHEDRPMDITAGTEPKEEKLSWLATYKPLLLVVAFITGISMLAAYRDGVFHAHDAMRYFMAGFFLGFSFFKFLDLRGFADSYAGYDLLARQWRGYGSVYPFIELGLGLAYLVDAAPFITNVVTVVVMGFSLVGVVRAVLNKQSIRCACLGTGFNLPMSTVTIVEDLVMVVMAAAMAIMV
ncbi:MAG: heavy-metal-associated domain-containing protein [Flavobacteriales bacterium]|nr:heavy-metal-associated domain-containing protein [Flavobacteriales bacterium]